MPDRMGEIAYARGVCQDACRKLNSISCGSGRRAAGRADPGLSRGGPPDVSPDGRWLGYASCESREDIYVMHSDGSALRQFADDVYRDHGPRWSPDGARLCFMSKRTGKSEIWTIRAGGSDLRHLPAARPNRNSFTPGPQWHTRRRHRVGRQSNPAGDAQHGQRISVGIGGRQGSAQLLGAPPSGFLSIMEGLYHDG
jgi:hypothetical protein